MMDTSVDDLIWGGGRAAVVSTRSGQLVTLRHIQPGDARLLIAFFHQLSPDARRQRFMSALPDLPDETLRAEAQRLATIDPLVEAALIATAGPPDAPEAVGIVRMKRARPSDSAAEAAIVLRDDYQGQGLGTLLFDLLLRIAAARGLEQIWVISLAENSAMRRLVQNSGYAYTGNTSRGETTMVITLAGAPAALP